MALNKEIWILAAKRTPFGAMSGALKGFTATDLAVFASKAAITQSGVDPKAIDHVIMGNVQQTSADASYLARHVGLRCEVPIEKPALGVNRLCGSGFQSIVSAAEQILLGRAKVVLAGGTENMTQAPHVLRGLREGLKFGKQPPLEDTLWTGLTDSLCKLPMGVTAENIAKKYNVSREDADGFALLSQQRWKAAHEAGAFKDELVNIEVPDRKGVRIVDTDECPRPDTTAEGLKKLSPVFDPQGVVTAGNASAISDGAGALIVADAEWARSQGLKPLAKLLEWGIAGVDPTIMGMGPVPAIEQALSNASLKVDDIDFFDINEAFAPQWVAVQRTLKLPLEKSNVNGGAIALGHPLGASGSRISANLIYQLRRTSKRLGIGGACIGGGQGIALIFESL